MKIAVIIALDKEYQQMVRILGGRSEGSLGANEIVLWQCGIGKVNAAIGALELINKYHPDCIISAGVAGGMDDTIKVMDVVVGRQSLYHDVWCGYGNELGQVQGLPARYDGDAALCQCAELLKNKISQIHCGLICTGDQFVTRADRIRAIKHDFPDGLAVDMESAAIAQVCYLKSMPFVSIRIISDTPANTTNQAIQYQDFWTKLSDQSFDVLYNLLLAI